MSNTKTIKVNQIVVKGNKGHVGVAHYVDGEIGAYEVEAQNLAFKLDEQKNTMANITWEVASLLEEASTSYLANSDARLVIAVPRTVALICNNIDILTRMLWTNTYLVEKGANKRQLSPTERKMYTRILKSYRVLIGKVIFQDSSFTKATHSENETPAQAIWADLNQMANEVAGISPRGPQEAIAETPVVYNAVDDEEDMPF